MSDDVLFSQRNGLNQFNEPEIIIRNEAPDELRKMVVEIATECGIKPNRLRDIVCSFLKKSPDRENNWGYSNIIIEIRGLITDHAKWNEVYDIIETICLTFRIDEFASKMNQYFIKNGIGWKITDNKIQARSPEIIDAIIENSVDLLNQDIKTPTTYQELKLAIEDLSHRPVAKITGAIQHAMAAVECYMRLCTGLKKDTLGQIIKKWMMLFLNH